MKCFLVATAMVALLGVRSVLLADSPISTWQISHYDKQGDRTIIPDPDGSDDLILPAGVTITDDTAISSGKVLSFDGSQTEAVHGKNKAYLADKIDIKFSAKLASAGATKDETLFYYFGGLEIRYQSATKALSAIAYPQVSVTNAMAKPIQVSQPAPVDKWVTVEAIINGSTLVLIVDGNKVTGAIPDGQTLRTAGSTITFGSGGTGRTFVGELADISLLQPSN